MNRHQFFLPWTSWPQVVNILFPHLMPSHCTCNSNLKSYVFTAALNSILKHLASNNINWSLFYQQCDNQLSSTVGWCLGAQIDGSIPTQPLYSSLESLQFQDNNEKNHVRLYFLLFLLIGFLTFCLIASKKTWARPHPNWTENDMMPIVDTSCLFAHLHFSCLHMLLSYWPQVLDLGTRGGPIGPPVKLCGPILIWNAFFLIVVAQAYKITIWSGIEGRNWGRKIVCFLFQSSALEQFQRSKFVFFSGF